MICSDAATIGSAKPPGLSLGRRAARNSFCHVFGLSDLAVVEETGEGILAAQHAVGRLGETAVAQQRGEPGGGPGVQLGNQRRTQLT